MVENRFLTLEQLEAMSWGDAPADESYLVRTVHDLRRKPLGQMSVEDLRILLGQDEGTDFLLPYALTALEANPLAEGDYYPGDLLASAMSLPPERWARHPAFFEHLDRIVAEVESAAPEDNEDLSAIILSKIREYRERRSRR
ncbi:MAG TPA: contact-dependent growth inhibition system immunity protein [Amycolatopsis sp.]|nr:contact-dependent growth inhibition system immunity protein [Amycolatopsis sp.]